MLWIGFAVEAAVGLLCIILGVILWKKQKASLLHDYHYKNVKSSDIPEYTKRMGIGLIIIGVGVLIAGALHLFELSDYIWYPLGAGFVIGIFIFHKAQMKYNGSWFS